MRIMNMEKRTDLFFNSCNDIFFTRLPRIEKRHPFGCLFSRKFELLLIRLCKNDFPCTGFSRIKTGPRIFAVNGHTPCRGSCFLFDLLFIIP